MAQIFRVTILVTLGAQRDVEEDVVKEEIQDVLDDFPGGVAEVVSIIEH